MSDNNLQPCDMQNIQTSNPSGERMERSASHSSAVAVATWREQPLAAETVELLEGLASRYPRIWLVVDHVRALRLPSPVEEWLNQRAYKIEEKVFSDYARLCLYSAIDAPLESPQIVTVSKLGGSIQLVGHDLNDLTSQSETIHRHPGEALRLSLLWQTSAPLQKDYTVFVQLLGADDRLWWQQECTHWPLCNVYPPQPHNRPPWEITSCWAG